MESEMIQTLQTIADNIQAASQPGVIEYLSIVISFISVVVSGFAIWFAVQVPNKIAEEQNRIAIFEKRYSVYREIYRCHTFGFIAQFTENSDEVRKAFLTSFEKEVLIDVDQTKIHMETDLSWNLKILMRIQTLLETLRQSEFLFADNPWICEYSENVASLITELVAPISMDDKEFIQAKKKFLDLMNDKMYDKVLDKIEEELQLKNI